VPEKNEKALYVPSVDKIKYFCLFKDSPRGFVFRLFLERKEELRGTGKKLFSSVAYLI